MSKSEASGQEPVVGVNRVGTNDEYVTITPGGGAPVRRFSRAQLADGWAPWQGVEAALRSLDPPAMQVEIDFLGSVPRGPGGRNGYTEMCQALANAKKSG